MLLAAPAPRVIVAGIIWLATATVAIADSLDGYPLLRESFDPGLQEGLERVVGKLRLNRAVAAKKLGVALVDITDLEDPRLAEVNGDVMMYAASLPKIAILLGAFVQAERGKLTLDRATLGVLTRMIRVSSNRDATAMLNRVGRDRVLRILQSDRFRLYDPAVNGGLWVGKAYGKSRAYRRDPLNNLSHGATAVQTARFFYLLETCQLVAAPLCRQMKSILGRPEIKHKFVKGLARYANVKIFRKSGTWRRWHADSAIVEAGRYKYIAVALAEDPDGGRWLERLIGGFHRLIVPATAKDTVVAAAR